MDAILGIGSNDKIVDAIKGVMRGEKVYLYGEKSDLAVRG